MHTPGPWINDGGLVSGKQTDERWGLDNPSFDIFDASEWPGSEEEGQANAKLIAAAPDLLAFAQAHEKWEAEFIMDSECWPVNESGCPVFNDTILEKFLALQKIRNAAIAKATGKE